MGLKATNELRFVTRVVREYDMGSRTSPRTIKQVLQQKFQETYYDEAGDGSTHEVVAGEVWQDVPVVSEET
jgi:hypothetical protein